MAGRTIAEGMEATTPLDAALGRVGDRWSLLLIEALLDGPRRFSDLGDQVSAIAPNILADRLRRLERTGVVVSEPYSRRPLRFTYRLSAEGHDLAGVLRGLAAWGAGSSALAHDAPGLRHASCGTPLEVRWYCPTCARATDDAEATSLTHL